MKTKQTKPSQFDLTVKLWTLKDKDSLFRAKEPDKHLVEIWADNRICIRDFVFTDSKQAIDHYNHLARMFKKGK